MKYLILLILSILLFNSCVEEEPDIEVSGLKPLYQQGELSETIGSEEPKAFGTLGKIVYANGFIYINEQFEGVHVIDNSVPANPVTKHFWKVPALIDFTIKDDILYAEQGRDLLVVDIKAPEDITLCNILKDVLEEGNQNQFPPNYSGSFECVDPSKGVVAGWEEALLINPKCSL